MPAPSLRPFDRNPHEPVFHDLSPVRFEGALVQVRLSLRQAEDGMWCGRLCFMNSVTQAGRETAEIFRGVTEQDLWQSVRGLGDHHFRDLYRSLG